MEQFRFTRHYVQRLNDVDGMANSGVSYHAAQVQPNMSQH